MSAEDNKDVVRRHFEECWRQGNLAVVDDLLDITYVSHAPPPPGVGSDREGFKQIVTLFRSVFPDIHYTVEDQLAEGDKVATRWTARGAHRGPFMGLPPSGKEVTFTGIFIDRIVDGKCVEHWGAIDRLGMMEQLGAVPGPAQTTT